MTLQKNVEVLVVGGGPVGLLLAGELRLGGASVLVVERLTEPSQTIKAGSIGPQSVEHFDRRGLLAPLQEASEAMFAAIAKAMPPGGPQTGPKGPPTGPAGPLVGHFSGLWLLRGGPLLRTGALGVPQSLVELTLAEWVAEQGVEVRRGCELVGLDADDTGARATFSDGASVSARFVVGCDGGRSIVRRLAGFEFPGTPATITGRQALVDMDGAEELPRGWNRTDRGMVVYGPGPNRVLTVEFDGPPEDREAPVTAEEIEASLRRVSGVDVQVTALRTGTRWTDNTRVVDTYRLGNVFLAGDAAHVHPPFGGQGLNLGFQDAANLGWKLAAVIGGRAPVELLDTYTVERRPVAERALANTRAQVALMRPDPQTSALRELFVELMAYDDANAHVSHLMTGVDVVYDVGCAHPDAGRYVADREVTVDSVTTRLYEHMRDGRAVLVDATDDADLVAIAGDRVRTVLSKAGDSPSVLVRPDGIVAWAGNDGAGLLEALL